MKAPVKRRSMITMGMSSLVAYQRFRLFCLFLRFTPSGLIMSLRF
jgi:hypothetical protein